MKDILIWYTFDIVDLDIFSISLVNVSGLTFMETNTHYTMARREYVTSCFVLLM
jgi:hypothetical protein